MFARWGHAVIALTHSETLNLVADVLLNMDEAGTQECVLTTFETFRTSWLRSKITDRNTLLSLLHLRLDGVMLSMELQG